jgi:hypothetical protein
MPYNIKKVEDGYRVSNKDTGRLYAAHTKEPKKLIAAIEINKLKKNGGIKH